jgi:hypothetical protein
LIAPDNRLQIASLHDLGGMKAKVVPQRAAAKDYLDIDALLTTGGLDLSTVLSAAQAIYGKTYTPLSTLKALSYFDPPSFPVTTTGTAKERADEAPSIDSRDRRSGASYPLV